MKKILVTGGTGTLGREVTAQLIKENFEVCILSSKQQQHPLIMKGCHAFAGDLVTKAGLQEATKKADIIIHCASNPRDSQSVDIEGTRNLLETINKNKTNHFIYVSIVGIDKSNYLYYQAKAKVEKMIAGNGIPFSILRTTQFHNFVLNIIRTFDTNSEAFVIPKGMRFQSIDGTEVAGCLAKLAKGKPSGLLPGIGGPQVLDLEEMVTIYLNVHGRKDSIEPKPIQGERYDLFRSGNNLCASSYYGNITWENFLHRQLGFDNSIINT